DEVPVPVGTVRAHEGEVGTERGLEDVLAPPERPPLLALGDQRAGAGRRVEGGDAGAAGPHALGERPLRHQLELDLARLDLLLDRRRPRRVDGERGDDFSDLPRLRQELRRERAHAGRVEDDRQVACAVVAQREEQAVGPALHDAEAAEEQRRPMRNIGHRGGGAPGDLVHRERLLAQRPHAQQRPPAVDPRAGARLIWHPPTMDLQAVIAELKRSTDTFGPFIRAQAERIPDRVALRFEDDTVTYGAYDRAVNRMAARLGREGVARGTPVAILAPNSPLFLVALGAITLAGLLGVEAGETIYAPLPLYHGESLFVGFAPAFRAGGAFASRRRFSASAFLDDVRRHQAVAFVYVGELCRYLLRLPP